MAVFRPVWPGWPICSYVASEYAGMVLPHTCSCNVVTKKPSPKEQRLFFLDRTVFDLVDAHRYLALTDPKLLGWYLCLSPEDRKLIQDGGGFHQFLLRHPALELSLHHVYVKYSVIPAQPAITSNGYTTTGATKCSSDLQMLPKNVRETLSLLGCNNSGDGSHKHPAVFSSATTQDAKHQEARTMRGSSHLIEMSSNSAALCKDPAAHASPRRRGGQRELRSQTAVTQGQSAKYAYAEVSPLQSEWATLENDSEYYSFDSTHVDGAVYSDSSSIQPAELQQVSSHLDPVEERCQDHTACGNKHAVSDDATSSSFEDQSGNFHSIMENDQSILACLTSEDVKALNSGVHSKPVTTDSEALAVNSETCKSVIKTNTAEKSTSMPSVTVCDSMIGTELPLCTSAGTQTEDPATADKHVLTEVHMTDLDYLAEELIKLKMVQDEVREMKGRTKSKCDCIQHAQQAELCLLALQYSMCTQYCWRLYHTATEGGQPTLTPKNPPADIASVLQKLESDYNQMRGKILSGVPLEQLKPLSVDSEKITTGASYTPAQIIGDVLGNVPSWVQKHDASGENNGGPYDRSTNGCQHIQRKEKRLKVESSSARRAVSLVPQQRDAVHNAHEPEIKRTTAACQELSTCEAWYDAEEDLEPAVAAETVISEDKTGESASEEVKRSILCVSNLPGNVTESDVTLWFEKHHATDVSICALKNGPRFAIVTLSGLQSAKAAVRELHGRCVHGRTLHVEHIDRAIGVSQSQPVNGPESSQEATKPETSKTDSSSTKRKLISQPPLSSSINNRKVVCITPTAKGTCVPQHYCTMGSFDTLMAELTQRHPHVGRQRIVDALMELKAKHQGVLSGLPLRTIREMTSELLCRPESTTQS